MGMTDISSNFQNGINRQIIQERREKQYQTHQDEFFERQKEIMTNQKTEVIIIKNETIPIIYPISISLMVGFFIAIMIMKMVKRR